MGCGASQTAVAPSNNPPITTNQFIQANPTDGNLKEENVRSMTRFKVLLLGAGESGKTTVIKQLKTIYKVELTPFEIKQYKVALHDNSLTMMKRFLEAAETFGYTFQNEEEKSWALDVKTFSFGSEIFSLTKDIASKIYQLWKTETLKRVFNRRNEFWNLDASDYYFENVNRFVEADWEPNEEDCIFARVITTGIAVTEFDQGPVHFSVVDVGGQRSERKKWMHAFDDAKGIVFVVSLAAYNQVLYEDESINRMAEELNLFEGIAHKEMFKHTPLFLFLNKKDLFEKMLLETDLSKCFPEYQGGADVSAALSFVEEEFRKRMPLEDRHRLHVYPVAARFKRDIKNSWEEVAKELIDENKKQLLRAQREAEKLKRG